MITIRQLTMADRPAVAAARAALWPDASAEEHEAELARILRGEPVTTLPLQVFVAEDDGETLGFCEVDLRSHADGCDPQRPVGYLEGWYVVPHRRGQGIGGALLAAAEGWARAHGCTEMGSDTWIDNEGSQRAHEALGFEMVDRCVHYRKAL
jgi:aminoglycoside 6'-N-acetyltransferase I